MITRSCCGYKMGGGDHIPCPGSATFEVHSNSRQKRCRSCGSLHDANRRARPLGNCGSKAGFFRLKGETPKPKELKCNTCGSQPHACEPGRFAEPPRGGGDMIEIAPNWKCITCGLEYAPLPALERGSLLRSSMGTTARYGELHSYGGANMNEGLKRARRK